MCEAMAQAMFRIRVEVMVETARCEAVHHLARGDHRQYHACNEAAELLEEIAKIGRVCEGG
jgi:hypothetical protein